MHEAVEPLSTEQFVQAGEYERPAGNPSQSRSVVIAANGLVATSQPLAAQVGLDVLQDRVGAVHDPLPLLVRTVLRDEEVLGLEAGDVRTEEVGRHRLSEGVGRPQEHADRHAGHVGPVQVVDDEVVHSVDDEHIGARLLLGPLPELVARMVFGAVVVFDHGDVGSLVEEDLAPKILG